VESPRSLWFESHLLADRAGRRALAAAERLGPGVHETILVAGDRLAAASPVVAQQFYRGAAAGWQAFGADGFSRWVNMGYALLTREPALRDAAQAYFSVAPKALARVGLDRLRRWCDIGVRVSATSRKLGAVFFEGTAALIDKTDPSVLAEWTRAGVRLQGTAGWRGEFIAQAYFAGAARVLPYLRVGEIGRWADLGVTLQPALRENQFYAQLPAGFASLTSAEREQFLTTAAAVAAVNPAAAAAFYTKLPATLRRLQPAVRQKVLRAFALVGAPMAASLSDIVPVAGALVQDIPSLHRRAALDLVLTVARTFPAGTIPLLRSLAAAYEEAPHAAVEEWVQRGLVIAAENAEAGVAYFALQSRTSVKVLEAASTAATLSDVQGLLRKYVQMLSGAPVSIRSADVFRLRSPLEEFPLENEIALPLRVDMFATHEDNSRVYRFLAAQLAGRREFGTYEVTLPSDAGGLLKFLRAAPHAQLLEDLFLVVEGYRVGAALARAYSGLAREQREITAQILSHYGGEQAPSQSVMLDALLAALLAGDDPVRLPVWLYPLAAVVGPCAAPLCDPNASVDDSLRIAQILAQQLAQLAEERPEISYADLMLDRISGDALLDPYFDDDGPLPAGETAQVPITPASPPGETVADAIKLQLGELQNDAGLSVPLSAEELQRLIEAGADLRIKQGYGDDVEGLGLYITDLLGKLPPEELEELRRLLKEPGDADRRAPRRWLERHGEGACFYYDEWDYHIDDYRQRWCRLREVAVDGDSGEFFNRTLAEYAQLIPEVRRQFQRIRPEMYRMVKGLEDGEDFDLNAVVNARVDLRANRAPSSKFYVARAREERDVATLFLIDMSASTDEPVQKLVPVSYPDADPLAVFNIRATRPGPQPARRIIDITKEALVIMAEALAEIGDAYAIYGFSGHGRSNVEFYLVKSFNEPLSTSVRGRIGAIEPKRSTRMGTALRHAIEKLAGVNSRSRHIILLSDGFPQDFDYGQDRRSNVYGLRDTSAALREAEASGITPFCITVDKAGHDYLREMCDGSRYMVIEDITALPRELPKIYQRVVAA
jgi:nitric oxide reductase NorD protein